MPHHVDMSRWLERRGTWQFALIAWVGTMVCCLLGLATVMLWQHGGQLHRGPFIGAFFFSSVVAVSAVRGRRRQRRKMPGGS
jgi:hypothetical protein